MKPPTDERAKLMAALRRIASALYEAERAVNRLGDDIPRLEAVITYEDDLGDPDRSVAWLECGDLVDCLDEPIFFTDDEGRRHCASCARRAFARGDRAIERSDLTHAVRELDWMSGNRVSDEISRLRETDTSGLDSKAAFQQLRKAFGS